MKKYKCLFNHELLILVTSQSPYQSYRENVCKEQIRGYIEELKDTDIDAVMCCPTAWKLPLYLSEVDPVWTKLAPQQTEPLPECDWKYYDKVYWRARRMMLSGLDPVKISVDTAHRIGKDIFMSYRMNDHHHNFSRNCPSHSSFWRDNPQFCINPTKVGKTVRYEPLNLNYLRQEVRDHFKKIIFELIDNYDFDGLELDFMRSLPYFPVDELEKGTAVMTAFVRDVRQRLDQTAEKKGRHLPLCVRVPRSLELCRNAGFDLKEWSRAGLIDMVNVSTFFINALNMDIEDFKKTLPGCQIFGEMHFIYERGKSFTGGFNNNILRKTPDSLYFATALSILDRGADGVSFFNFDYVRDHSFADPRKKHYPGIEPHFNILQGITNVAELRGKPKLYHWGISYGNLPLQLGPMDSTDIDVYIGDPQPTVFSHIIIRLETDTPPGNIIIKTTINGHKATPEPLLTGELVMPLSQEGLPIRNETLSYYSIPAEFIKHGWNQLHLSNETSISYGNGQLVIKNIQLALK